MTLAREADLARAVVEGYAKPRNKEEREFVASLHELSELDRYREDGGAGIPTDARVKCFYLRGIQCRQTLSR